jgi:hypothetical protein
VKLFACVVLAAGCGATIRTGPPAGPSDAGVTGDAATTGPNADYDHDGYTPAQGDCDDDAPLVNPGAMEIVGNGLDDDCDGVIDEIEPPCPPSLGASDATALASALDQCDPRFLLGASLAGPSDVRARLVTAKFGSLPNKAGGSMALLSTGLALDKSASSFVEPQDGTILAMNNNWPNPEPTLLGAPSCMSQQPQSVNDYTELVLSLRAPTNAWSLSFQLQFFSAEFPEFVCSRYNDELLVEMQSPHEFPTATNISYDLAKNPITVNNSFFTVCQNDTHKPQTQHCTRPVSQLVGTGYEDTDFTLNAPIGGSTDWLTTTAPVTPGELISLRFIIFDEGDHIYDSAVLIDNLQWSPKTIDAPTTIQ